MEYVALRHSFARADTRNGLNELFFDLVFVLVLTQCTALMADDPTWEGLAKGVLVLGVMWWSWVGYSWLTSVVDPEEGTVRLAMFAAMAAFLVVALCVPGAFGDQALLFAGAYAVVRYAQVALFVLASRDDPGLRHSVWGLAVSTGLGVVAGALWWLYFDVVALVAERRLSNAPEGRVRNEIARDSFSYLHFPMVAGIVLLALGLKKTLEHVEDPLKLVPATALLGGTALYLLAHVVFRWRNVHRFSGQRLVAAVALVALVPAAVELPALATLALLGAALVALIVYESRRFADLRDRLRHQLASE